MRRIADTRSSAMVIRLTGIVLAWLALAAPASALAQQNRGAPSASELWRQYPLGPKRPTTSQTATPSTVPRRTTTSNASQSSSSGGGGSNKAALAGLTVLTLAILTLAATGGWATLYTLRRKRARAAGQAAVAPAAPPPAPSAPRNRRFLKLVADPAQEEETPMPKSPEPEPEPAAEAPAPALPPPLVPPDPDAPWTAEIAWAQGEGRCRFYAVAAARDGGEPAPIVRSSWMGWPPDEHTPVTALADAVAALERELVAAGWTPLEPGSAWYAKRFAWTPVADPELPVISLPEPPPQMEIERSPTPRRFVRATEWPEGSGDGWRCEIRWSAGYVSSRFQAVALPPGQRKGRPVGESAPFKWLLMSDPDPRTREHDAAVTGLEDALLEAGWERAGRGQEWYSERFVWPGSGEPPERVEPVGADAAARTG
jgi:hypothetical protein